MWWLEWGKHFDKLPERVQQKAPTLQDGLGFYYTAYYELLSERQSGMEVGQIPWYSIVKWAEFHGLHDRDEIDILIRYIRSLERAEFDHAQGKGNGNDRQ